MFSLLLFQGSVNFKFGVIYAKDGQTSDDEMYCNGKLIIICEIKCLAFATRCPALMCVCLTLCLPQSMRVRILNSSAICWGITSAWKAGRSSKVALTTKVSALPGCHSWGQGSYERQPCRALVTWTAASSAFRASAPHVLCIGPRSPREMSCSHSDSPNCHGGMKRTYTSVIASRGSCPCSPDSRCRPIWSEG